MMTSLFQSSGASASSYTVVNRGCTILAKSSFRLFCPFLALRIFPREARPKAERSGVYNFVPQRAQAG